MSGTSVAVLLIGLVIVLAEGAMVARGGWDYLTRIYHDPAQAQDVAVLVLVPVLLLAVGAVLLVATVGVDPAAGIRVVLARSGVIFLLTAGMHVAVMRVLSHEKTEVEEIELAENQIDAEHGQAAAPPSTRRVPKPLPFLPKPRLAPPTEPG